MWKSCVAFANFRERLREAAEFEAFQVSSAMRSVRDSMSLGRLGSRELIIMLEVRRLSGWTGLLASIVLPLCAAASDPPPDLARRVAERESASEAERANYTYTQTVTLEEYNGGQYREVREVIFTPGGERTEQMVGKPRDTLKRLRLTPEDFADMREIQPLLLTKDRVRLYQTQLRGEETIDGVDCWVLQVKPRQLLYGQRLFEGLFWIDKQDYSIVRSEGRAVPQHLSRKPGQENLFPYFTTVRQKFGEWWFPIYTHAEDTLHFSSGPVRMKLVIRYRDYKRFSAESTITPQ